MKENKKIKINPYTRKNLITCLGVIVFFAVSSMLVDSGVLGSLYKGLLIPMCYYILLAVSLNLTVGILGELSLGHAGFMCIGAYTGGLFAVMTQDIILNPFVNLFLSLLVGGLAAGLFGLLIGIPMLRLRGDYLAIVTLAFGEIVYKIIQNCYLIKDAAGLHFSFAKPIDLSTIDLATKEDILQGSKVANHVPKNATLLFSVILVLVVLVILWNIINSRAGRAAMAIRDNRIAAESIGINISKYKMIIFFVSAALAGVAGALYASNTTLDPAKFNYNMSILILVFVVLGGLGNMRGSIIAAILLYALPELLREFQAYRMLLYAIILIVMMIVNNNPTIKQYKERFVNKFHHQKTTAKEEA